MTQTYITQTLEAGGIPRTEFRYSPDLCDIQIISIEFQPETHPLDDYYYSQPQFVFGDQVVLREQYEHCQVHHLDLAEALDFFKVCALELVEPKSKAGRLTDSPSWLYGIRCDGGTRELIWYEQEELISKRQISQDEEDLNEF